VPQQCDLKAQKENNQNDAAGADEPVTPADDPETGLRRDRVSPDPGCGDWDEQRCCDDCQQKEDEGKHSENEITAETFLRISRFENPRRVSFKDRTAITFDFSGNPDAKTHGMAENALKKVSGTVWIDEESRQLVRMEAKLDEPFKIGGGLLASVQKGSSFVFEQAFVNGEIWLPIYAEANVVGRMLLFKGIREHSISRFSDYRKFRVASKIDVVGQTPTPQ